MSSQKHKNRKMKRTSARKIRPLWSVCFMHLLALGIALLVYALPHHVVPRAGEAIGTMSTRAMLGGNAQETAAVEETETLQEVEPEAAVEESEPLVWELDLDEAGVTDEESAQTEVSAVADDSIVEMAEPEADDTLAETENAASEIPDFFADAEEVVAQADTLSAETETSESEAAETAAEIIEEPVDEVGSFRIKFADKFTEGKTKRTKTTYQSKNLNIKIKKVKSEEWDTVYYVVDIYVADISCFMTAFAQDKYGTGYTAWPLEIAGKYKSVITMNGDYYGMRKTGVVIRNGKLYRNRKISNDVCVLYWDGTMKTFSPGEFNTDREMANGAYQAWNFGPRLLDEDGKAKTKFNSNVTEKNPRSAVGYFEPGHYCFVAVDGRNEESDGLSMKDLAKLMERLGCKQAYNLDGGRTSMLYAGDTRINRPVEGGRKSSDVLMIVDKVTK